MAFALPSRLRNGEMKMSVVMSRKAIMAIVLVTVVLAAGIGGYYYYYLPSTRPLVPNPSTVIWQTFGEPDTLDPARNYESAGSGVLEMVADTLVGYQGETLNIIPKLLDPNFGGGKGYTLSTDGLVYTFKLRPGLKFHDGTPLDAKAVKYNFDRTILINDPDGPTWMLSSYIKGGPTYFGGDTWGVTNQAEVDAYLAAGGVKVIDDLTVQVTLEVAYAPFVSVLAYIPKFISPTFVEANGGLKPGFPNELVDKQPIGSGPFKFVEWVPEQRIVLVRNDDYWGTKASVQRILVSKVDEFGTRLLAFLAGETDFISTPAPNAFDLIQKDAWLNEKRIVPLKNGYVFRADPISVISGMELNQKIPPLDNKNFRAGVAHSMDYDQYINSVANGFATQPYGFLPPGYIGYSEQLPRYAYNADLAKQFFLKAKAEGAYTDGTEVTIFYNAGNEARRLGSLLLADGINTLNVGVTFKVQELAWPEFLAKIRAAELPIFFVGWLADYADPDNWLFTYAHSEGGVFARRVGYHNETINKLVVDAGIETDNQKRAQMYFEIQKELLEEYIYMNLSTGLSITVHRDWIGNFYPNPIRAFMFNYEVTKAERTDQVAIQAGTGLLATGIAAVVLPIYAQKESA